MSKVVFKLIEGKPTNTATEQAFDIVHHEFEGDTQSLYRWSGTLPGELPQLLVGYGCTSVLGELCFPTFSLGIPVVNTKFCSVLDGMRARYSLTPIGVIDTHAKESMRGLSLGELIPKIASNEYALFRVVEELDCFNPDKSTFTPVRINPLIPNIVENLCLSIPAEGFPPIFRVKYISGMFFSEEMVEAFRKEAIYSVSFEEIEVNE